MLPSDYTELIGDIKDALARDTGSSFAIIGHTPTSYDLRAFFAGTESRVRLLGIYAPCSRGVPMKGIKNLDELLEDKPDFAIVASDVAKEELLEQALPFLGPSTKILVGGSGHLAFRDPILDSVVRDCLVPSLANGYSNSLTHIYQCLQNAARLELEGVVVEFGVYKGGTTMVLSRLIEHLGRSWKVVAFDTFAGFPPKRSALDMYDHPDFFCDEASVRRYLAGRDVEIISGDIVSTVGRIHGQDVVLAFVDTDNFSSAKAVLDVIQDRVVAGGAIIVDHFTGRNRGFRYTLGERLAAKRLLDDKRYFHLHDTGVFFKHI